MPTICPLYAHYIPINGWNAHPNSTLFGRRSRSRRRRRPVQEVELTTQELLGTVRYVVARIFRTKVGFEAKPLGC